MNPEDEIELESNFGAICPNGLTDNQADMIPVLDESRMHYDDVFEYAKELVSLTGEPITVDIYDRIDDSEPFTTEVVR